MFRRWHLRTYVIGVAAILCAQPKASGKGGAKHEGEKTGVIAVPFVVELVRTTPGQASGRPPLLKQYYT